VEMRLSFVNQPPAAGSGGSDWGRDVCFRKRRDHDAHDAWQQREDDSECLADHAD
jgi:hypothetical protein